MRASLAALCLWVAVASASLAAGAAADSPFAGGHAKARLQYFQFPPDSLLAESIADPALDQGADLRLTFSRAAGDWNLDAHYQLFGISGDTLASILPEAQLFLPPGTVQNDNRRLLDLTQTLSDGSDYAIAHRLDRLSVSYSTDQWVARLGRQAISWGNGLMYNPVDIFNPFDPTTVDQEYKSGDDMAYAQYLRSNGDDLQAVWVLRRDDKDNVTAEVNSLAVKYHGFIGENEYDLLLAHHYDQWMVAAGGIVPWGGAVLRGDLSVTDGEEETAVSAVLSWSYSWVVAGKNMSGLLEYYYNGFGLQDNFDVNDVLNEPDLVARVSRGEQYVLGKHQLGASLLVEVTPLLNVTPNLFVNLRDGSLLAQLVARYDMSQNWQLLLAASVPAGSSDTEYGGFGSASEGLDFSYGSSIIAQLAWYF